MLLHRFLACLEQAPRRKQPVDLRRSRHLLESFGGRLGPALQHDSALRPVAAPQMVTGAVLGTAAAAPGAPESAESAALKSASEPTLDMGRESVNAAPEPAELVHFQIDHVFDVSNVGTVASGTVVRGEIALGNRCWWGPSDADGTFTLVKIAGIHRSQVPVVKVSAGQYATLALDAAPPTKSMPAASNEPGPSADAHVGGGAQQRRDDVSGDQTAQEEPASTAGASDAASYSAATAHHQQQTDRAASALERPEPAHTLQAGAVHGQPRDRSNGADALPATGASPLRRSQRHGVSINGGTAAAQGGDTKCTEAMDVQPSPEVCRTSSWPAQAPADTGEALAATKSCPEGTAVHVARPAHRASSPGKAAVARAASPLVPASLEALNEQLQLSHADMRRLSQSMSRMNTSVSPDAAGSESWQFMGLQLAGAHSVFAPARPADCSTSTCSKRADRKLTQPPDVLQDAPGSGIQVVRLHIVPRGAGLPSGAELEQPAPKGRKGTVLLDERAHPHAASRFGAFLILTNGQWPARGLVSGRWPPDDGTVSPRSAANAADAAQNAHTASDKGAAVESMPELAHSASIAISTAQAAQQAAQSADWGGRERGRTRSGRKAAHAHIIHCGSIRQAAHVAAIQELRHDLHEEAFEIAGVNLTAAAAAAAVLLERGSSRQDDADDDEDAVHAGTLVDASFEFTRRQEWLVPGMRFVVRDQRGHVSGVGVVHSIAR
jgi:hypothetical protein